MLKRDVSVRNTLGLHARAAAQLVKSAQEFSSDITIVRVDNGITADAKSILSVLTLAASRGTVLHLQIDGIDEANCLKALQIIFENGFGEI